MSSINQIAIGFVYADNLILCPVSGVPNFDSNEIHESNRFGQNTPEAPIKYGLRYT